MSNARLWSTTVTNGGFWQSISDNTHPVRLWAKGATRLAGMGAITIGSDIYFGDLPAENSVADLPLIGHELTHSWHVEAMSLGTPLWLIAHLTDTTGQLPSSPYRGNLSEVAGYAMEATITALLAKYPNLFYMIQNGTVNAIPGIRDEIRSLFVTNFNRLDMTYRLHPTDFVPD